MSQGDGSSLRSACIKELLVFAYLALRDLNYLARKICFLSTGSGGGAQAVVPANVGRRPKVKRVGPDAVKLAVLAIGVGRWTSHRVSFRVYAVC